MTPLAPRLEAFFLDRLLRQRQVSAHTVAAYRDSFRLLLRFAQARLGKAPSQLALSDLDAALISAFLNHLETDRHNTARTRNARHAALRAFFRYAALDEPAHAALLQRLLAMPSKRCDRPLVRFLSRPEVEALLAAPDRRTWLGRRDHALLLLAVETGLRVSELTGLRRADVVLGPGAHVHCRGKGRKDRGTPLTRAAVRVLHAWLRERPGATDAVLFPNRRDSTLSRDAVERLVQKHAAGPAASVPRFETSACPPTCSGTRPRSTFCRPGSIAQSSPCGSGMSSWKPPRCTSRPTSPSKRAPSREPRPCRPTAVAIEPATSSWPSSRPSDYAASPRQISASDAGLGQQVGIIRQSA